MFKIRGRFIGTNSLGFINGNTYIIKLFDIPQHIGNGLIIIETIEKKRIRCGYSSWERFINNWEILHYENTTGDHDAEIHHTKVNNGLKSSVRESKISKIII